MVVISHNQLKNLRGRYGSAGSKDDRFDAYVLADTLRTDRARLRPLTRNRRSHHDPAGSRSCPPRPGQTPVRAVQPAARSPAARVPRRGGAVRRARLPDQPGVPDPLPVPGPRGLAQRETPHGVAEVGGLLRPHRPGGPHDPPAVRAPRRDQRGRHRPRPPHRRHGHRPQRAGRPDPRPAAQIAEQLALHADAHVFCSLPRSGTVRAARLLAEIGDARGRFPDAASLACLAGVAPSTRQSGKTQSREFPLGRQQRTPRRPVRLRQRLPTSQPLGRHDLQRRHRPRQGPPTTPPASWPAPRSQ